MKRPKAEFQIPIMGLGQEQKEEIEDLLRLAEDLGYICPMWQMEFMGGGLGKQGGAVAHIELSFTSVEFQAEFMLKGLRSALEDTEEVQEVLNEQPTPKTRQLIVELFG